MEDDEIELAQSVKAQTCTFVWNGRPVTAKPYALILSDSEMDRRDQRARRKARARGVEWDHTNGCTAVRQACAKFLKKFEATAPQNNNHIFGKRGRGRPSKRMLELRARLACMTTKGQPQPQPQLEPLPA